jgi:hypothetical protein
MAAIRHLGLCFGFIAQFFTNLEQTFRTGKERIRQWKKSNNNFRSYAHA